MITITQLRNAARIISLHDKGSVLLIRRDLGLDTATADEILDGLINLGLINKDEVYRKFNVPESTKTKIIEFLDDKEIEDVDDLFDEAAKAALTHHRASTSLIQRACNIGNARAARIIDQLEEAGLISPSDGTAKPREVYPDKIEKYFTQSKAN